MPLSLEFEAVKAKLRAILNPSLGVRKMGEEGQKVETCRYKISQSWRCNVQDGDYS